jgi:formylglycine-generating enzyme required for sulfatase activity
VEDDYHSSYTGAPTDGSAWIDDPRAAARVVRGGSFDDAAGYLRAAYRSGGDPAARFYDFGLRCAR